jgi:hypothetical protein
LVDVLSVLRFTYSDYPYGIFNLFLLYKNHLIKKSLCPTITIIESGSWEYVMENTLQPYILKNNQRDLKGSCWFSRIYKLECMFLHNTFPGHKLFFIRWFL